MRPRGVSGRITRRLRQACGANVEPLDRRTLLSVTPVVLATLDGAAGRAVPRVAVDAAGDVFGTTLSVGESAGAVYEVVAGTGQAKTLATFGPSDPSTNVDGIDPGDILIDAAGNLFGDAAVGGTTAEGYVANGTLWELPAGASAVRVLYTFPPLGIFAVSSGFGPTSLSMDSARDLFGSAEQVIPHPYGTAPYAFEYVASSGTTKSVYGPDRDFREYASMSANVASSAAGDAYVLEESPLVAPTGVSLIRVPATAGSPAVTLATYATPEGVPTGAAVPVGVAVDPAGDAVLTVTGSASNTVAEVAAGALEPAVLATLQPGDGKTFVGNPVVDAAGDLFAVTSAGGADGFGSLVELKAGASDLTVLMPFTSAGEAGRVAGLTVDAGGDLFATRPTATGAEVFELQGVGSAAPPLASSLSPSVSRSTVPATVLFGTKVRGTVTVTLDNSGTAPVRGTDRVDLYAVADGQVARLVGSAGRRGKLAGHGLVEVVVPVKPVELPAGSYTLIAVVTDAAGGKSTATTGPAVTVNPVTVTLSARVSKVSSKVAAITSDQAVSFTLTLTNSGDGPATGPATVTVKLATADGGTTVITTSVKGVPASPVIGTRRSKSFRATLQVQLGVPAATPATLTVTYAQTNATAVAAPIEVTVG